MSNKKLNFIKNLKYTCSKVINTLIQNTAERFIINTAVLNMLDKLAEKHLKTEKQQANSKDQTKANSKDQTKANSKDQTKANSKDQTKANSETKAPTKEIETTTDRILKKTETNKNETNKKSVTCANSLKTDHKTEIPKAAQKSDTSKSEEIGQKTSWADKLRVQTTAQNKGSGITR